MEARTRAGAFGAGEVIQAISGRVIFSHPSNEAARRLAQAGAGVDAELAELALQPLLAHLEEHPRDVDALMSLVLICSAHPEACEEARCSARTEAARLVSLLESEGAFGWAAALRERFNVAQERALRSRLGGGGEESEPPLGARRRARFLPKMLATALAAAAIAFGVWREVELRDRWDTLPPAVAGDLASVEARVEELGSLIDESGPWLGLPAVAAERLRLEGELRRLERAALVQKERASRALELRWLEADRARERGLLALEAGSSAEARQWFTHALERGGERWLGAAELAEDLIRLSEGHVAQRAEDAGTAGDLR